MSSALKNRLVGTIIVVALAVIFLPELLDGEKQVNRQEFMDVPPMPAKSDLVKVQEIPLAQIKESASRPMQVVDELPDDDKLSGQQNSAQTGTTESPQIATTESVSNTETQNSSENADEDAKASSSTPASEPSAIEVKDAGWVVQLGSFSNQENVKKLVKTLTNAGYRAYSRPIETKVGRLSKVFVGPEIDREELEKAIPHLKELTGLSGKITEFDVSTQ